MTDDVVEPRRAEVVPRPSTAADASARLERLLEAEDLLARVSREIGPALNVGSVLSSVIVAMRDLVSFRGGSICLVEEGQVRMAASDPPASPEVMGSAVPVGEGLAGRVVATAAPVYSPDLDTDRRVDPGLRRVGSNAEMRSWLGVPLVCLGEVIGLLQVDSVEVDGFDDEDLRVLSGLATYAAGAIESARRYQQVVELEQLKHDFMTRVSHELRTPVSIVTGLVATLRNQDDRLDPESRRDLLTRVDAAARRLAALIEQVLTMSRLDSDERLVAQARPRRMLDIVEEARAATDDPSQITVQCPAHLMADVDAQLLSQGLRLLLDNALKYAGRAEVTVGNGRVDVRDHGRGIPPEVRRYVFESFTRGHLNVPGMGVGLAMARTLIEATGGRLELADAPGGGTSALIELPSMYPDH